MLFRPDVGTVFDHRCKLVDVEVLMSSVPNAFLQVKRSRVRPLTEE